MAVYVYWLVGGALKCVGRPDIPWTPPAAGLGVASLGSAPLGA